MIKRIKLINWRSHKSTELEFEKGSNVLIGKMGAGKSSVINAICFALFGTFPELQRREATLNSVIMDRPAQQEHAKVELEFIHNGKEYKVERTIYLGTKTNDAKLYEGSKLLAGPKVSDVNKRIAELLEIDYELFSRAVYSEQNQIDYFLKLNPSERKAKFDELLDLERYEKVRKNAVTLRNSLKALLEDRKTALAEQRQSFSANELEKLSKEIESVKREIEAKKRELEESRGKLSVAEKRLKELIEKQKKYNELNANAMQLRGSIATLKEQLKKLFSEIGRELKAEERSRCEEAKKELEKELEKLAEKEKELNEVKSSIREAKAKIAQIEEENASIVSRIGVKATAKIDEEVKKVEAKIEEMKKKLQKHEEIKQSYEKELTELRKKIAVERNKIAELSRAHEELKKAKAYCPVCKRKLTAEHRAKLIKEYEQGIASSRANIKRFEESEQKLAEQIKKLADEKLALDNKLRELVEIKATILSAKENVARVEENKKRIAELKAQIQKLEEKEKSIAEVSKEVEKAELKLEQINKELEAITKLEVMQSDEERLRELEAELNKLAFDEEQARNASIEFEKIKGTIRMLEEKIAGLKALTQEKDARKKELEGKKELIENLERKVKTLEKLVDKLGVFINVLKATQSELRENLIENINQAMAELWPKIYPYGDYEALKLRASDTYELVVKTGQRWQPIEGMLSGGERSAAALTLRIAFSLVLARNLSMLILDEPTHNLDERTVSVLSEMVKNVLPNLVEQIFLITHNKEMEKAASATLYLLDRDKDTHGITRVELLSIRD